MHRDELVEHYPSLFHMASAGSWPIIQAHGLWTTQQIVATSEGMFDEAALTERRPHSITAYRRAPDTPMASRHSLSASAGAA
jgi:hypothetical protein